MTFLLEFGTLALTAIFLENVIFSRALGTSRMLGVLKRRPDLFRFGLLLTGITVLSSCLSYPVSLALRTYEVKSYFRPFVYLAVVTLVYVAVYWVARQYLPRFFARISPHLTFATFNCAVLGTIFLAADQNYSFAKWVGFGLGSGLGFTFASLLVREGTRRLALCDVPKAFRGFPLQLMYLGLVALAMYGLVGHQLPF